jgi:adenylate cyclase
VFAGEIGEPRGRREFNILGDAVNVAARLMSRARLGEILMTPAVRDELGTRFATDMGEKVRLKGLADELHVFSLRGHAGELRDTASAREAVPTVPTAPIRHDMPPSRLASAV